MGDFRVKKIILPSGKAVEIVYFHAEDGAGGYVAAGTEELAELAPVSGLECCGGCAGDLVHPVDWRETADDRWELELRCPIAAGRSTANSTRTSSRHTTWC